MENSVKKDVCSFHKLYKATQVCRKNVRWKDSVAHFSNHSLKSVHNLKLFIESGKYQISPYSVFEIREPKLRKITSTRFKDRVFQRSLCDNYLTREISKNFIPNNYACQKDKGTDRARECLTRNLKMFCKEHGINGYVLKLDIHDYFGSTNHEIAIREVNKRVKDEWTRQEVERIIRSFGDGVGIGLGSQVSQLIQLAVLDDVDHYITEHLGINLYVRYMDDFIIIHEDKEYLRICLKRIRRKLNRQKLDISPKKTQISRINQPIRFLGFTFKLWESGKVTWRLLPSNIKTEKRKLRKLARRVLLGKMSIEEYGECYKSWRAHAMKSDSRYRIRKMDQFKEELIYGKKKSN